MSHGINRTYGTAPRSRTLASSQACGKVALVCIGAAPVTIAAVACIACGARRFQLRRMDEAAPNAWLLVCRCGLARNLYLPDRRTLTRYYRDNYHLTEGQRCTGVYKHISDHFKRRRAHRLAALLPPRRILDIGCGRGLMLAEFKRLGWQVYGTEISNSACSYARNGLGLAVDRGELTELDLGARSFSVATLHHVLEHLPRPQAYLARVFRVLQPGGVLIVEVPNFAGLTGTALRRALVRARSSEAPVPLHAIEPATAVARRGFDIDHVSHFSAEYSLFVVLQTMLNRILRKRGLLAGLATSNACETSWHTRVLTHVTAVVLLLPAALLTAISVLLRQGGCDGLLLPQTRGSASEERRAPPQSTVKPPTSLSARPCMNEGGTPSLASTSD